MNCSVHVVGTIGIADPLSKKQTIYDLYRQQLKSSGAKHVLHFEMYDGDRLVYAIFFRNPEP